MYPSHVIGGVTYDATVSMTITTSGAEVSITATIPGSSIPVWRPVETCAHCHNFYIETIVARSFEEAVELGWLVRRVDAGSTTPDYPRTDGITWTRSEHGEPLS